jgi:hypothetical protein
MKQQAADGTTFITQSAQIYLLALFKWAGKRWLFAK